MAALKVGPSNSSFIAWSLLLLLAAAWEANCKYTMYDLKRSVPGCTILEASDTRICFSPSSQCVDAATVRVLSPRWLSNLAGRGGPLLSWVPMLLLGGGAVKSTLACVIGWYLTLIAPVRHVKLWHSSGFDPSGHVFVYGSQLIPYAWMPHSRLLSVWCALLLLLSCTTAAFFHTPAETFNGWLLILLLHALLHARVRVGACECVGVACAWCLATGIFLATGPVTELRVAEITYDGVLFLLLGYLVSMTNPVGVNGARGGDGEAGRGRARNDIIHQSGEISGWRRPASHTVTDPRRVIGEPFMY